jgi:hypothetical protein
MAKLWPTGDELAGFKATMLDFERANWAVGMKVLACFAAKLGFPRDFFTVAHDPLVPEYQSTLRLLHYLGMEDAKPEDLQVLARRRPYRFRLPDALAPEGPVRAGFSFARARTSKAVRSPGRMCRRFPA